MRRFTPDEIRRSVRGRWRWPAGNVTVLGVSTDSRTAGRGQVFVALRGENFDGHDFVAQAASAGCVTAVVDQAAELDEGLLARFEGGVIGVGDTLTALGDLAAEVRSHLPATVVAVTGSNGKTTVKRMIHHILSRTLNGWPGVSSFNNAVGVPLTLFAAEAEHDYVICELGSSAPGEIASLTRIARPDVAVITSVSAAHLEGLIHVGHVAAEKAAILGGLSRAGVGVVWADSEPLARALKAYDARLIRFGQDSASELRLTGYEPRPGGGRLELNGRRWVDLAVPGRHNAFNALAAIAVAQRFGLGQDEAAEALGDYAGEEMRLETIAAGLVTIINDAYNANPASLLAAGEVLASCDGKRRVLVAGDMRELGPTSAELHQSAGQALAALGLELIVGVGEMGGQIAAAAERAGAAATGRIDSVEQACARLPEMLKRGDVVLLKGSRAVRMERLVDPVRSAFERPRRARPGRTAKRSKRGK